MEAAEKYVRCIDAVNAQRWRLQGEATGDSWDRDAARRFRYDPGRELDANIEAIAAYVRPQDTVIDVGGGAGRVGLPLALRCRQVINIDPSPAMRGEFEESAAEAGIENARFIQADWLDAEPIPGDVVITANVTYFVRDISAFIKNLDETARRRVVMNVWSVPPPNQNACLFRLVYGEQQEAVPGHRQLLPVLWEMGILPDVYLQPGSFRTATFREGELPKTREAAVQEALRGRWLGARHQDRGRQVIEQRFQELYEPGPEGYRPIWRPESREMLITWETQRRH